MKTIKQIYDIVIESLVTEKLLNRDIEQRIKTDKSYNPIALDFYKFLKTKNVTYEFYHGTSNVAFEMMKKDGYITSPFLRGTSEFEARKGSTIKNTGVNQVYFTTIYNYAKSYADRECRKFKNVENFKDFINIAKSKYNFSDEFIKENNVPIILKITIPLYLLAEVGQSIYFEEYRNELGMDRKIAEIVLNKELSNEEKLKDLIKYIDSTKDNSNEFTVIGLLPVSRVKGFEMVKTLSKEEEEKIIGIDVLLVNAAENGDLEKVKYYIQKSADIHIWDDYALRHAAKNGHLEVVKFLVEKGANIHANDEEALKNAAYHGYLEIVKLLIENGANVNAYDNALRWAAYGGHLEVVKYLVENGANIRANDDEALRDVITIYKNATGFNKLERLELFKYLIKHGANVHANNDELYKYIKNNSDKLLEIYDIDLLDYIKSIGITFNDKLDVEMSFKNACKSGDIELVKKYYKENKNIIKNLVNDEKQTFMKNVIAYNKDIFKFLFKYLFKDIFSEKDIINIIFELIKVKEINLLKFALNYIDIHTNIDKIINFTIDRYYLQFLDYLIKTYKIDVHANNERLLQRAISTPFSRVYIIKYLIEERGADISKVNITKVNKQHTSVKKYLEQKVEELKNK